MSDIKIKKLPRTSKEVPATQALLEAVEKRLIKEIRAIAFKQDAHDSLFDMLATHMVSHDRRFDAVQKELQSHGARFDAVQKELESHGARFDAVQKELQSHGARFDAIEKRFDAIDARFDAVDARFAAMDRKFDEMRAEFNHRFSILEAMIAQQTILYQQQRDENRVVMDALTAFVEEHRRLENRVQDNLEECRGRGIHPA